MSSDEFDFNSAKVFLDQTGRNSLIIPSKQDRTFIFADIIDQKNEIFGNACAIELVTDLSSESLYAEIRENDYTGKIKLYLSREDVTTFSVLNGVFDSFGKSSSVGRVTACGTFLSDSWVYNVNRCVDDRMGAMNWLEYGECLSTLPGCYARQVAYCMIDGCPIQ